MNKNYVKKNYEIALKQVFLKMDQMLQTNEGKTQIAKIMKEMRQKENASKNEQECKAGCTANVCLITQEFIYVANAGTTDKIQVYIK